MPEGRNYMKQSKRIAFCGMMSALTVVIMLVSYFPYLTFAVPAVAGLTSCIILIELNSKWSWGSFVSAALLSILLCEKESATLFLCFFGFYPILKSYLEKIKLRAVEYILKFGLFTACVCCAYFVIIKVFGIPMEGMGDFGKYTPIILLALGEVMFFFYDIAITRVVYLYMVKFHDRVQKMLK